MRKTVSAIFLTILLICPSMAQIRKSEREHEKLIGPVKTIRVENSKLDEKSGKWVEKRRSLERTINYNTEGNKTKEIVYDGQTKSTVNYSYDEDGSRTDSIFGEHFTTQSPYFMNSSPGIVPGTPPQERSRIIKLTFKFDQSGNRVEQIQARPGNLVELYNKPARSVFAYDDNGNIKEATLCTKVGQILGRSVYKTDSKGNVLEQTQQSPDGTVIKKYSSSYEFDSRGNWIKRIGSKWEDKGDKSYFEPKEVTYRKITYYGDDEK